MTRPQIRPSTSLAAVVLTVSLLFGCTFDAGIGTGPDPPRGPVEPQIPATPLEVGKKTSGRIDCATGNCVRRYEIALRSPGQLTIRIEPDLTQEDYTVVRAILSDPVENVIGQKSSYGSDGSFSVGGPAKPGRYSLSLQSGSGALDYVVTAQLDTSAAAQTSADAQMKATQQIRDREIAPPPREPSLANPLDAPSGSGETKAGVESEIKAGVAKNPQVNFQSYRRYAFGQNPEKRLENAAPGENVGNPFIDEQIQRQIRYVMADSGYFESQVDQAQFLILEHTGLWSSVYYSIGGVAYGNSYSYYFNSWGPYGYAGAFDADLYTQATLVIDVVDVASKKLVWHGWTTKTTGWVDNDVLIRQAVTEILSKFP